MKVIQQEVQPNFSITPLSGPSMFKKMHIIFYDGKKKVKCSRHPKFTAVRVSFTLEMTVTLLLNLTK